jgi:hypothetical protein
VNSHENNNRYQTVWIAVSARVWNVRSEYLVIFLLRTFVLSPNVMTTIISGLSNNEIVGVYLSNANLLRVVLTSQGYSF